MLTNSPFNKVILHILGNDPYDHTSMDVTVRPLTISLEDARAQIGFSIQERMHDSSFCFYRAVLLDVVTGESMMLIQENKPERNRIEVNLAAKARTVRKTTIKIAHHMGVDEPEECDDMDEDEDDIQPMPMFHSNAQSPTASIG